MSTELTIKVLENSFRIRTAGFWLSENDAPKLWSSFWAATSLTSLFHRNRSDIVSTLAVYSLQDTKISFAPGTFRGSFPILIGFHQSLSMLYNVRMWHNVSWLLCKFAQTSETAKSSSLVLVAQILFLAVCKQKHLPREHLLVIQSYVCVSSILRRCESNRKKRSF